MDVGKFAHALGLRENFERAGFVHQSLGPPSHAAQPRWTAPPAAVDGRESAHRTPGREPAMSTQQERAAARRQEKLDQIEEQKKEGSLVVRKLTPEELKENQPRPPREKRPPRRYSSVLRTVRR